MRQQITMVGPVKSRGASGEELCSWETVAMFFAEVQPLKGREYYSLAKKIGEELVRFVTRARDDISTEYRLVLGGVSYGIRETRDTDAGGSIIVGVRL